MPDARVSKLVRELKNGADIAVQLTELWHESCKKPLSRADSLSLAHSVVKIAESLSSTAALRAWYQAVLELRKLAKYLKKPNSTDPLAPLANVEKYCINYALRACQAELDAPDLPETASVVAAETLRLLFECRTPPPPPATARKPRTRRQSQKENIDPGRPAALFDGAERLDEDFLPREESALVASVVTAAVAIRVAAKCDALSLPTRLHLAQGVGLAWADHLGRCDGDEASHARRKEAHLLKMKNGLLIAAKMPGHDPEDVLHARAFAITICEQSIAEYSYNALRVVNSFLRRSNKRAETEVSDHKVVSRVYRGVLSFLEENGVPDDIWTNEDVSTLIDHLISIGAKCKAFEIPSRLAIPSQSIRRLLKLRLESLNKMKSSECEKLAHVFQEQLWATQGYELLSGDEPDEAIQVASAAAMKSFPSNLLSVDEETGDETTICSKSALRIIRILEPFRKHICQSPSSPTADDVTFLELYMNVYEKGFQNSKCTCSKSNNARYSGGEIISRLEKMIGSVVETAEKLIAKHLAEGDADRLGECVKKITTLLEFKTQAEYAWEMWLSRKLYNAAFELYKTKKAVAGDSLSSVGDALVCSVEWLAPQLCPDINASFQKHEQLPDFVNILVLAVHCFIASSNIEKALNIAASKLLRSFCFESSVLDPEMLSNSLRTSLLTTCGQIVSFAAERDSIPDFVNSFGVGQALPSRVRRNMGNNFVQALSEYSLYLRPGQESRSESTSASRLTRMTVKARHEILKALKLPGKCLALQTQHEWMKVLLDGISPNPNNQLSSKSRVQNEENLLTLADITAETPKGGWNISTVSLDNGESMKMELSPRLCSCTICSSHDFVLLHLLKDSWEAGRQRSPLLLREHLGRLEHFISSCELKRLHKTLLILTLDLLEWCQVLSILSSIDDRKCLMSSMIDQLKQELELSSAQNPSAMYVQHGFLSGWPYYSDFFHGENCASDKLNSLDQEEFKLADCKSDVFLHNLDLVKALDSAKRTLISLLDKLKNRNYDDRSSSALLGIGGVEIQIVREIISLQDRFKALQTLELVHALDRLGSINFKTENFNDSSYFFEKAVLVSKALCGEQSLVHLRQKSVLYKSKVIMHHSETDVDDFLQVESHEFGVRSECKFDNTLVSNTFALAADIALSAVSSKEMSVSRKKDMAKLAAKLSTRALDVLHDIELGGDVEINSMQEKVNTIISQDVSLLTGQADLLLGNANRAISVFEKIKQETQEYRFDVQLSAILGLINSLVLKIGSAEKSSNLIKALAKPTKGKRTRKSKDAIAAQRVSELIHEAMEVLVGSQWEPHIRTELFLLHASMFGPTSDNMGLAWEIGNGFSLQWGLRNKSRRRSVRGNGSVDDIASLVQAVQISSNATFEREKNIERCKMLLRGTNIVVVGMSLDQSMTGIIFWRLSASGFFTTHLEIPADSESSYECICDRLSNVFDKMKANAVKMGDSFTEDEKESWWEKTFELDEEIGDILEDIEVEWLGASNILLLPASSAPNDVNISEQADDHATEAANALASIEVCYKNQVSKDSLSEAFESLSLSTDSLEDLWNSTPDLDISECKGGNTVFVLDSRLEHIPFESLSVLRKNKIGSTRVPSLSYLMEQLSKKRSRPNPKSVYYVLNPAGDLPRTEKKFRTVFEKRKGWKGVSGKAAMSEGNKSKITIEVQRTEIFLYCGHGSGEKFFSPRQLSSRKEAPVAVLMGCSSAKLTRYSGYRGSSGTPLDYLLHGAPAVVGNLWDVTDKDIDRLTAAFLKQWLGVSTSSRKTLGIADSLAAAREACKLPYLVGAATIIYGLPFL